MKKIILLCILSFVVSLGFSQTKEELEQLKKDNEALVDKYQAKADSIKGIIDDLPGWRVGAFGTVGGSLSNFSNWYAQGIPNNDAGNIGFTVNGYANRTEDKYFWNNALTLNLNWVKLNDRDDPNDDDSFRATTDVFNLASLYGYKIKDSKWAASAFAEYRSTIIDNFNDPGYLDLGVGFTWKPNGDLTVVLHPLNYNFVFADDDTIFDSSLGAKIVADYSKEIGKLNIKSNLSVFQSYEDSDLSNWTWTNSFGYTIWKNIGLGFDFGLRDNKQEAVNYQVNTLGNEDITFDNVDNDLQSFWTFGLSYKF